MPHRTSPLAALLITLLVTGCGADATQPPNGTPQDLGTALIDMGQETSDMAAPDQSHTTPDQGAPDQGHTGGEPSCTLRGDHKGWEEEHVRILTPEVMQATAPYTDTGEVIAEARWSGDSATRGDSSTAPCGWLGLALPAPRQLLGMEVDHVWISAFRMHRIRLRTTAGELVIAELGPQHQLRTNTPAEELFHQVKLFKDRLVFLSRVPLFTLGTHSTVVELPLDGSAPVLHGCGDGLIDDVVEECDGEEPGAPYQCKPACTEVGDQLHRCFNACSRHYTLPVTITSPADGATVDSPVTFTATAEDIAGTGEPITLQWLRQGAGSIGFGSPLENIRFQPGTYTIRVDARDSGGNTGYAEHAFTVR